MGLSHASRSSVQLLILPNKPLNNFSWQRKMLLETFWEKSAYLFGVEDHIFIIKYCEIYAHLYQGYCKHPIIINFFFCYFHDA